MLADLLISLLAGYGVETRLLARKPGLRTSATILPIPAWDRLRPALPYTQVLHRIGHGP